MHRFVNSPADSRRRRWPAWLLVALGALLLATVRSWRNTR